MAEQINRRSRGRNSPLATVRQRGRVLEAVDSARHIGDSTIETRRAEGRGQRAKGQKAKGKGQRAKGKGQRAKGKGQMVDVPSALLPLPSALRRSLTSRSSHSAVPATSCDAR